MPRGRNQSDGSVLSGQSIERATSTPYWLLFQRIRVQGRDAWIEANRTTKQKKNLTRKGTKTFVIKKTCNYLVQSK
jgi:hypothetical protein